MAFDPDQYKPNPKYIRTLPYGVWSTDYQEVLFNRSYKGIGQRSVYADGARGKGSLNLNGTHHMTELGATQHPYREEYFRDDGQFNPRHPDLGAYYMVRLQGLLAEFQRGGDIRKYLI